MGPQRVSREAAIKPGAQIAQVLDQPLRWPVLLQTGKAVGVIDRRRSGHVRVRAEVILKGRLERSCQSPEQAGIKERTLR